MNSNASFDQQAFVNGAVQSLSGSLCIEEALHAFILYLKRYMPIDVINAGVGNSHQTDIRYLAVADGKAGHLVDETVRLSSAAAHDGWKYRLGTVVTANCISSSLVAQESLGHFMSAGFDIYQNDAMDGYSIMTLTIGLGKPVFAYYTLAAFGRNRYSEAHRDMLLLLKPPLAGAILNLIHHRDVLAQNEKLKKANEALRNRLGHHAAARLIGAETGLKHTLNLARQVAGTDSPVLLTGETGTGKELFANAIHQMSRRSDNTLVSINCGAIPENLVDSELFGYEKGAFTGASERKRGYFEQADGGTLFMDEVAELPLAVQVKLLRVLQEKTFYRVGGQRPISVNIRLIAATHRILGDMVNQGAFRKDLWFRLNVFPITLPPLRDRKDDIPEMARHIAVMKAEDMNLAMKPVFAPEAMDQLRAYHWPGNIRELQNIIEHRLIITGGSFLSFPDLCRYEAGEPLQKQPLTLTTGPFSTLHDMISSHIREALRITGGKIYGPGGAAELLGLKPSTLKGKMLKYGIDKNV